MCANNEGHVSKLARLAVLFCGSALSWAFLAVVGWAFWTLVS